LEDESLYYFSCESFESSFDLEEPLFTIEEDEEEEDNREQDDDDSDFLLESWQYIKTGAFDMIESSAAHPVFQETKHESNQNHWEGQNLHNFQRISGYGQPILTSFYFNESLISDLEHDIKLFTISEEPELEELYHDDHYLSRYRERQKARISLFDRDKTQTSWKDELIQ
jgi:hypothetical protein